MLGYFAIVMQMGFALPKMISGLETEGKELTANLEVIKVAD